MASTAPVPPPEGLPGKVHLTQSLAAGATFAPGTQLFSKRLKSGSDQSTVMGQVSDITLPPMGQKWHLPAELMTSPQRRSEVTAAETFPKVSMTAQSCSHTVGW